MERSTRDWCIKLVSGGRPVAPAIAAASDEDLRLGVERLCGQGQKAPELRHALASALECLNSGDLDGLRDLLLEAVGP